MAAIVSATGLVGLLASAWLRAVGLHSMWIRYGVAVGIAYGAFMFFVWLWLQWKRRQHVDDPGWKGEGLDDRGSTWEAASTGDLVTDSRMPSSSSGDFFVGDLLDADEGIVWVAIILAIGCLLFAAGYVIFIAPELLAELLLDGVLSTALYRRLRRLHRRHWVESVLARTWIPTAIVAVAFVIAGAVCQRYAPEATSLGDVWRHWQASR
jgi:hypothetical protein